MENLHHIVVVGGGAGGLELVTRLGNKLGKKGKARVTLVDAGLTHVWKPLLHEVASGSLDANANEINYRAHARKHHYEFQLGRMNGLDRDAKELVISAFHDQDGAEVVPERRIRYDTLVIAVGSTANDFGTPGAQEHCLFLDSLSQARRFHNLMLNAFLRKNHEALQGQNHSLNISIIGAGATGVELAAELRLASRELPVYGMNHLQPSDVSITVIEAADRILPALPARLSAAANRELEHQHINVLTGQPVSEVRSASIVMEDGTELPSEMTIWLRVSRHRRSWPIWTDWKPTRATSWWSSRPFRPPATTMFLPLVTVPPVRNRIATGPCRPGPRQRISRRMRCSRPCATESPAATQCRSFTTTTVR